MTLADRMTGVVSTNSKSNDIMPLQATTHDLIFSLVHNLQFCEFSPLYLPPARGFVALFLQHATVINRQIHWTMWQSLRCSAPRLSSGWSCTQGLLLLPVQDVYDLYPHYTSTIIAIARRMDNPDASEAHFLACIGRPGWVLTIIYHWSSSHMHPHAS
jgi:hypothetical protein